MRFLRIVLTVMVLLIISSGLSHGSLGQGHVYVANKLLAKMPPQLKKLIEKEKSAYLAGANGVDIVYWAYYKAHFTNSNLPNVPPKPFDLHTNTLSYHTGQKALEILDESKKHSMKEEAFAVGWLTHWLVDAYVHTLIGYYGGDYRDDEKDNECTPTGSCRHTQLEIAESKHLCSSEKHATYSSFLKTYSLSQGDIPEGFIEDLFKKGIFVSADHKDIYMQGSITARRTVRDPLASFITGKEATKLEPSNLDIGRDLIYSAIECCQYSCSKERNDCRETKFGVMSQNAWERYKQSFLLDKDDYFDIRNAIRISVDKLEVKDGSLRAEIDVKDTQLYGKFLVEWDRVISDLEKFVDEVQLFDIVQAFLGPAEADPAEEKAKEALQRVLNQIPNILTPRNQMSLLDPKTTKRYTDGTLRGAPDIKTIAYEIASTCDGGKTFNKIPSKSKDISFHAVDKQRIKLFGSKSGSAVINVKLGGDGDKSCQYVLLVSLVNPGTGDGSYKLDVVEEGGVTRVKMLTRNPTAPADPDFRFLEYDWTADLKLQAEWKYQLLQDNVAYLEALREFDRKTFVAFKNSVTSAMVRQFVASHPSGYEDGAKLPDCKEITGDVILRAECAAAQQAGCGTSVGDARIRMNQYGSECSSTLKRGCNVVKMIEVTRKIDGKDVKVAEPVTDCDEICGKARACEKVFTTYSGRAGYASDVQGYVNENYQRCLGEAGTANGRHQKELSAKIAGLPKTLPYERWQEYKAYNDWKGYLAAVEKVKREYGLSDPIPSSIVLPWTYTSPCGGGEAVIVGGSLRISLKKKPEKTAYIIGEKITLTAEATGGKAPYNYEWSGDCEGKDASATFPLNKTGQNRVKVRVKDSEGGTGEGSITFEVAKLQLDLNFEPKEPYVGQEVKAMPTVKPEVREIDFRWMPLPDNAKPTVEAKDGREIAFTMNNDNPAEIKVRAMTPKSGEVLGEGKNTIKAKKYTVNVTGPKTMGPKPKIWKEGVGLVDVEKEIAVDQVVEFAADTQPAALTGPVKYKWTATSDSCTLSNATSRAARATASAAGGCALSVVITDRNDVQLGEGKGSFNATVTREEIRQGQEKARNVEDAKKKVQDAKVKERKGDLDGAIVDVDGALKLDKNNREAASLSVKFRKDRETIGIQLEKARTLMGENRFPDAQRELIVAKNLHGLWPPVLEADRELGDKWRAYDGQVRDKIYEVRSASEKKEFGKALEIAAAWRASTKLDPYAEKALNEQEDWARKWKAQKEKQIGVLKEAGEKVKNCDYAGALKQYDEGLANGQNIYNGTEPEYKEALELRGQAFTKNKRLGELSPVIRDAAENRDAYYNQNHVLEGALKAVDEAVVLQPNNEQLKKWREQIVARAEKTKADNERTAAGRKHLEAARNAENSFLSQDSYIRGGTGRWSDSIEGQMQANLAKAIENYRESLKDIPDAAVEKHIGELEANLEARKKFAENVRLSKELRAEGDTLVREGRAEASFEASQAKFAKAIEKYNQSLGLYRPPDETTLRQIIHGAGMEKLSRAFRKFYTDCGALEREGKIVEALAACEKAVENRYAGMHEGEWILLGGQVQNLRSRVAHAKKMRAQGESEERAGKIAEAVASYRDSLKNLPDPALEEHVKSLEARLGEANRGKTTADRLWQEGAGLYSQGQYGAALDKFKESLGHGSDATRSKYVQDLEARKTRAKQLRDEGYALQQKNQVQTAIGKYRESLKYWPDKNLEDYIRQLAAQPPATPVAPPPTKPTSPAGVGTVPSRDILTSKVWQFGRSDGTVLASKMRLLPGGRIEGASNPNESQWAIAGNELLFYDSSGKMATRYNSFRQEGGRWVISGPFLLWGNITHVLREIAEGGSPPVVAPVGSQTATMPTSTASAAAWSGAWRSDPGPDGETLSMNLTQSGNRVSGTYRVDEPGGRRIAEGTVEGSLSGSSLSGTFRASGVSGTMEGTLESGGVSSTVLMRSGQDSDRYRLRQSGGSGQVTQPASSTMSAASQKTVVAEITNKSNQNTHIFPDGETFSPSNRLVPGEKRKVNVSMKADGSVVFKAGRNGQVMATKTWRGNPGDSSRVPVVVFDESNPFDKLTVTTGLR